MYINSNNYHRWPLTCLFLQILWHKSCILVPTIFVYSSVSLHANVMFLSDGSLPCCSVQIPDPFRALVFWQQEKLNLGQTSRKQGQSRECKNILIELEKFQKFIEVCFIWVSVTLKTLQFISCVEQYKVVFSSFLSYCPHVGVEFRQRSWKWPWPGSPVSCRWWPDTIFNSTSQTVGSIQMFRDKEF